MRNCILIMLIFLLNTLNILPYSILDTFNVKSRILYNYNGSASNGNNIIIYGDAGIVVRSNDGLKTFDKVIVSDDYNIVSITNISKVYYGLFNKDYMIISYDDGKTWKQQFIANDEFIKIKDYNNFLFCLSKEHIFKVTQDGEILKKYDYTNQSSMYDFEIIDNSIYFTIDNLKLGKIDLNSDEYSEISFLKYGTIYDDGPPSNLFKFNNELFFKINKRLYRFNDNKISLYSSYDLYGIVFPNDNKIYNLYNHFINVYNIDSIYFYEIEPDTRKKIKINDGINDRYFSNLSLDNINVISKDTIIATGKDNTIFLTTNSGITWHLISHFDLKSIVTFHFKDDKNIFSLGPKIKFIHTTNGGITWLPQTNNIYNPFDNRFENNTSNSHYFKDKFIAYYFTEIQNESNLAYSDDKGETVNLINSNGLIGYPPSNYGNEFVNFKNNLYFKTTFTYIFGDWTVFYKLDDSLQVIDRWSFDSIFVIKTFVTKEDELLLFALNVKYNENNIGDPYLSLFKTEKEFTDLNEIWNYKELDETEIVIAQYVSFFDRYLFFAVPSHIKDSSTKIFCLNIANKTLKKIYELTPEKIITNKFIQKLGNAYYLTFATKIDNNINYSIIKFSNLDDDEIITTDIRNQRYNLSYIFTINDSLAYVAGYDSLTNTLIKCLVRQNTLTKVEEPTNIQTYLYLNEPYPVPAKDKVTQKFYFNSYFNPQDFKYYVFDIFGKIVSNPAQFEIQSINNHSAYVTWHIPSLPAGVYFISIAYQFEQKTKKIIIQK